MLINNPKQLSNLADKSGSVESVSERPAKPESNKKDIFVSYCWTNSYLSKESNEISKLVGNEWNDPRRIKSLLADRYNGTLEL